MRRAFLAALIAGCAFDPSGLPVGGPAIDADPTAPDATDAPIEIDAPMPIDGPVPLQCPGGYVIRGTGTYRHISQVATWNAARADCENDDDAGTTGRTHLVVIDSDIERAGVRAVFAGPKLWIGLSNRVTTRIWRWVTLEDTAGYPPGGGSPWKGGQPNDGGGGTEDCVIMESDAAWDDRPCDNDMEEYVCECDAFVEVASQSDPQSNP